MIKFLDNYVKLLRKFFNSGYADVCRGQKGQKLSKERNPPYGT